MTRVHFLDKDIELLVKNKLIVKGKEEIAKDFIADIVMRHAASINSSSAKLTKTAFDRIKFVSEVKSKAAQEVQEANSRVRAIEDKLYELAEKKAREIIEDRLSDLLYGGGGY